MMQGFAARKAQEQQRRAQIALDQMAQEHNDRASITADLLRDQLAFGVAFMAIYADGKIERVDPMEVRSIAENAVDLQEQGR